MTERDALVRLEDVEALVDRLTIYLTASRMSRLLYDLRALPRPSPSDGEVDALERIENTSIACSETQRSWKHRCYAIMGALGFDFGDPDWEMPDDAKAKDEEIARLREALEECLGAMTGGMDGKWSPDVDPAALARAALSSTEERGPMCRICGLQQVAPPNDMCTGCESYLERQP